MDVAELLNSVGTVLNPSSSQPAAPLNNPMPRWQRIMSNTLPEVGAAIVSTPFELYSLADAGSRYAFDKPLPGAEDAREISESIRQPVRDLSNRLAGEPISDNLLSGDAAQLAGSWARLGLTAGAVAPAGVATAAANAASKIKTGIKTVDAIGEGALKTLEVLSPVVISKNPTPGLVAANVGVAGALGTGLEAILGPTTTTSEAKQKLDSYSQGVTDSAAEGVKEAKTIQAGIGGSGGWEDVAAFGLLAAASIGAWKRDVAYRAIAGLDKGEATNVPLGTIIREQLGDATAPIDQATRKYLQNQNPKTATDIADAYESRVHERHGASIDTKLQQAYEFGQLPDSGIKITPINDTLTKYRSLTPDQQQAAIDALNARHELDTRQRLTNQNVQGAYIPNIGTQAGDHLFTNITRLRGWDDKKVAYHMADVPTADLFSRWNGRVADPAVAGVVDEYLGTMKRIPQYLYEQRAITKKEMLDLQRQNPHYVGVKLAEGNSHLSKLNPQADMGLKTPGNPFEEIPKYFDEVVRFVEANKIRRTFLGTMIRAADAGDSYAKSLLGRRDKGLHASVHAGDRTVRFRDVDGRARDVEVNDPVLRRALQNVGRPAKLTLISGGMKGLTGMSRFFENAAVGPLAAMTGSVFAPVSAMYSMGIGTAMRDKRLGAAGWLDKAVQSMTEKAFGAERKFGVRGDVLTLAPDAAFRAAQGVAAVMAQRASRVLRDSVLTDGRLSKLLGPQAAQTTADALSSYFQRSWVNQLQQRGQLGPASLLTVDPAKRFADAKAMLQGQGVVGQTAGLVGDILHAISSSPAASLMAMNKSQPAWKTNKLVREFSGDPSRSGAFAGPLMHKVGAVTSVTPWGNIFLQANIRLARAFKQNPTATTVGIFNAVGIPAALSTLHNASQGPEYSDYQYNVRSPDRQAGYVYVALPGKPPEMGLEIPVDPLLRPFKHGIEVLTGAQLGLLDGSLFKPENAGLQQAMAEMVGHRQGTFKEGSVMRSIAQQSVIPPLPPAATALAASQGVKLRSYMDSSPIMEGKHGFSSAEGKNPLRTWEYPQTEEVISALGADAMRFIYNVMSDGIVGAKVGKDAGEIAGTAAKQYGNRVKDSTKYVSGALFDQFQAISPATEASGRVVKEKLDTVENVVKAYQEFTDKGAPIGAFVGSAKRGYSPLPQGAVSPTGPAGAPMLALAETLARFYPTLNNEYLGSNKDDYNARAATANSLDLSPAMKRAWMNHYGDRIIERDRKLLQHLQLLESNLSRQFGVQIKLDKIDLNRGIEQFKPLN